MITQHYGYYVYGIAKIPRDGNLRWGGISYPAPSEEISYPRWEDGVDPAYPVQTLAYRDIHAIVSKVPLEEFGQEALETNLHDPDWLEAKVRAHESVLDTALAQHTLIPMRFGTIFLSESRVQEMLARCYDDFVDTLARLEGKKEWGIKVYADDTVLAERSAEFSERARQLEAEIAGKSGGAAYLWKKKLDEVVAAEIERICDECAECTHNRLSSRSEESVVNSPPMGQDAPPMGGRTVEMILNGAYLVADECFEAFRTELASIEENYNALGFGFHVSGPWSPYNFVQVSNESVGIERKENCPA